MQRLGSDSYPDQTHQLDMGDAQPERVQQLMLTTFFGTGFKYIWESKFIKKEVILFAAQNSKSW